MAALKRTERLLQQKATAHYETSEQRSIRLMHAYLEGAGTDEQRAILEAHYAERHPEHTARMANCALCELEARKAEVGLSLVAPSLAKAVLPDVVDLGNGSAIVGPDPVAVVR
jgi:hypothetical protein